VKIHEDVITDKALYFISSHSAYIEPVVSQDFLGGLAEGKSRNYPVQWPNRCRETPNLIGRRVRSNIAIGNYVQYYSKSTFPAVELG